MKRYEIQRKKIYLWFVVYAILLLPVQTVYAQTIADVNTSAGYAYLQAAAEFSTDKQWDKALFQAELGAAYLPSLADFHYIQARALVELGYPRADSLQHAYAALNPHLTWRLYDQQRASLLCVRLLIETQQFEPALMALKHITEISADKDFYYASSLYGLGKQAQARAVIFSALQRYPFDFRFTKLFFAQESRYTITPAVKNFARQLISRMYIWQESHPELLVYSAPFAENPAEAIRRLKIYRSQYQAGLQNIDGKTHSSAIILALKFGIIDERTAIDEFFSLVDPQANLKSIRYPPHITVYHPHLTELCRLITDEYLREELFQIMDGFSGVLYNDKNNDGIISTRTKFYQGRPLLSEFDPDQDGYPDYIVESNFGTPARITGRQGSYVLEYDMYPAVNQLFVGKKHYIFRPLALNWSPINQTPLSLNLVDNTGEPAAFFTLTLQPSADFPSDGELLKTAVYFEHPKPNVENSRVRVYMDGGVPISAETGIHNRPYAVAQYRGGIISVQQIDRDGDDYFETRETYSPTGILKKITLDVNKNNLFEYCEEYSDSGKITKMWDNDENGIYEIVHTLFPNGNETTQWIHPKTGTPVTVQYKSGIPRLLTDGSKTVPLLKDNTQPVYWLNYAPDFSNPIAEKLMSIFTKNDIAVSSCIVTINQQKIFAVRSGGFIFAEIFERDNK